MQNHGLSHQMGRLFLIVGFMALPLSSVHAQAEKPTIYVSIVTHNEEPLSGLYPDFTAEEGAFWQHRDKVAAFAQMLADEGASYNYQSDWNFLQAATAYDTGTVSTNEKNLIRWLSEDFEFGVDPHAHETSYNYADVAYLINSLGVQPSKTVGGFICHPPVSSKLEYFRDSLSGWEYDYDWKAEILWGGATHGHQADDSFRISGVWKPQDNFHFLTHDPQAPLPFVGGFNPCWEGLDSLLELQAAGELTQGRIYTQTIMVTQLSLASTPGIINQNRQRIESYQPQADSGLIEWVQLEEVVGIWHDEYGSLPSLYSWIEGDITPGVEENPSLISGLYLSPLITGETTTIRYHVPETGSIRLDLYDVSGRFLKTLIDEVQSSGEYSVVLDASEFSSGVYFCRLRTSSFTKTETINVIR